MLQANVQTRAILRQEDKAKPITPLDLEPDRFRIQILVQVRSLAEPMFIPADIPNNQLCFLYKDEDDDTQYVTTQDEFETALRYFREEGERPVRLLLEKVRSSDVDTTSAIETSFKVMVVQLPDDDLQPDSNSSEDVNIDRIQDVKLTDKIRFRGFDSEIHRLQFMNPRGGNHIVSVLEDKHEVCS
jgi:hypothetical protein